jgi:ribonuclease P protein component
LQRDLRLRNTADFKRVYAAGSARRGRLLVLHARPNEIGHLRVGVAVSSKLGGAAKRNGIKRRIREVLRDVLREGALSLDIVVVARSEAKEASFSALSDELRRLFGDLTTGC